MCAHWWIQLLIRDRPGARVRLPKVPARSWKRELDSQDAWRKARAARLGTTSWLSVRWIDRRRWRGWLWSGRLLHVWEKAKYSPHRAHNFLENNKRPEREASGHHSDGSGCRSVYFGRAEEVHLARHHLLDIKSGTENNANEFQLFHEFDHLHRPCDHHRQELVPYRDTSRHAPWPEPAIRPVCPLLVQQDGLHCEQGVYTHKPDCNLHPFTALFRIINRSPLPRNRPPDFLTAWQFHVLKVN